MVSQIVPVKKDREFFHQNLPFTEMKGYDELTSSKNDYCFAKPGQVYAIYLPNGGTTSLNLGNSQAAFTIQWYNPRTGGELQTGTINRITGPGLVAIGQPPKDINKDWTSLIKLK